MTGVKNHEYDYDDEDRMSRNVVRLGRNIVALRGGSIHNYFRKEDVSVSEYG